MCRAGSTVAAITLHSCIYDSTRRRLRSAQYYLRKLNSQSINWRIKCHSELWVQLQFSIRNAHTFPELCGPSFARNFTRAPCPQYKSTSPARNLPTALQNHLRALGKGHCQDYERSMFSPEQPGPERCPPKICADKVSNENEKQV